MKEIKLKGLDISAYTETLKNGLEIYLIPYENKKNYEKSYSNFEKAYKSLGITPYRVATDLKFSPMLLSDWKNGWSKPKLDTMVRIANYLNVPVTEFIE